jgi:hypothetical protein
MAPIEPGSLLVRLLGLEGHMIRLSGVIDGLVLAAGLVGVAVPAVAANVAHVNTPATSGRSSADIIAHRASARASNAAGIPYVNPDVTGSSPHSAQNSAAANANAAEILSAHSSIAR